MLTMFTLTCLVFHVNYAHMSNKDIDMRTIGILLKEDAGYFDTQLRKLARLYILEAVDKVRLEGPVTRKALADALGMDRNRVVRLAKALGVEGVFG